MCIDARKQDGGIYGYPATLLLFCAFNALGASLLRGKGPFQVLMQPPFNGNLTNRLYRVAELTVSSLNGNRDQTFSPEHCFPLVFGERAFACSAICPPFAISKEEEYAFRSATPSDWINFPRACFINIFSA